jgi:hypothetical protein
MRTSLVGLVGLVLSFLVACNSGGQSGGGGSTSQTLAPPAVGMQLATTGYHLDTGEETYQCWSFLVPSNAPISLIGMENQVPQTAIHHWAVFTDSDPYKEAGPWECATMGISWGLVSGGGVGTPGVQFPQGTAMTLAANQHIVFQLHLLNTTGAPHDVPPAYMNLVGTNATNLQPVGLLIAGTLSITIPPVSSNVQVTGGCTLAQPMPNIFSVFPHMHQLGKRITAEVTPMGSTTPEMLADQTWNFSDQGLYKVTGSAAVGDTVDVSCYYDNPTANPVNFGLSTKDEMCVNVLYYYPAASPSTYCGI